MALVEIPHRQYHSAQYGAPPTPRVLIKVDSTKRVFTKALSPEDFERYRRGNDYRFIAQTAPDTYHRYEIRVPTWQRWILVIGNPDQQAPTSAYFEVRS